MIAADWDKLKTRYLEDDLPTQLRSIASNLARIKSITRSGADEQVAQHLIRESQFFIEWTAPGIDIDIAAELVDLQRQLSYWKHHWPVLWSNPSARLQVAEQAQRWYNRVLGYSWLLTS